MSKMNLEEAKKFAEEYGIHRPTTAYPGAHRALSILLREVERLSAKPEPADGYTLVKDGLPRSHEQVLCKNSTSDIPRLAQFVPANNYGFKDPQFYCPLAVVKSGYTYGAQFAHITHWKYLS